MHLTILGTKTSPFFSMYHRNQQSLETWVKTVQQGIDCKICLWCKGLRSRIKVSEVACLPTNCKYNVSLRSTHKQTNINFLQCAHSSIAK